MKSLKTIQALAGIGKILSRIAFIFSVIGFCGCIAGLLSLGLGSGGELLRIGGITLHGVISGKYGVSDGGVIAALVGWLFICAGEAVLAKFAEICFKNEQKAGTPFTLAGAKELLRLGILTIVLPTGCAVLASIAEGIAAGFLDVSKAAAMDMHFDSEASVVLGVMFILGSLLCRYGAELSRGGEN